jgi:hypothetical protein
MVTLVVVAWSNPSINSRPYRLLNDTATASPKGPLSPARYGLAATGNSSFGYFGGGSYSHPYQQ